MTPIFIVPNIKTLLSSYKNNLTKVRIQETIDLLRMIGDLKILKTLIIFSRIESVESK
jgi:hypothetical protein